MTLKKYIYELLKLIICLAFALMGILVIALISSGICFLIFHKIIYTNTIIIWNIVFISLNPFLMPWAEWARKFTEDKLTFLKD